MWLEYFYSDIEHIVFYIFAAVSALILVLCFALMILGCVLKTRIPGGSMDFYIAIGGLSLVCSVLIRGIDPDWAGELSDWLGDNDIYNFSISTVEELQITCQFFPSVLTFGLCGVIGGLLLRCCALYGYYRGESKITSRYEWIPNLWMILFMLIDAALVIVWLIVYEIRIGEVINDNGEYICDGDDAKWWRLGISIVHAFYLLLAIIWVWPAIHFTNKTPNDGDANILSVVVYNIAFVAVAGTLLWFLYDTDNTGMYAINGGLILYAVLFTILLLIIGRITAARRTRDGAEGKYNNMEDGSRKREKKSKKRNSDRPQSYENRGSGVYESPRNSANMQRSSGNFDY